MNSTKEIRISILLAIIFASVVLFSCTKDNSVSPVNGEVYIQSMSFSPASITITAGQTITWTNKDGFNHTVTSDSPLFDSGNMEDGATFSFTFINKGTYPYHCTLHAGMTGTIIVN